MATKEIALEKVAELNSLPHMSPDNAASKFSKSISWHPHWNLIFNLIADVRTEYYELTRIRDAVQSKVANGRVETITDWDGGWEWRAKIVRVDGKKIRVFSDNTACIYKGQHDRPVITLGE